MDRELSEIAAYSNRKQPHIDTITESSDMKPEVMSIVRYGTSVSASIDWNKLSQHTRSVDLHILKDPDYFTKIRHIHFLDDEEMTLPGTVPSSWERFYLSHDRTWLLVFGTQYSNIEFIISLCKKRLELLDIRCRKLPHLDLSYLERIKYLHIESLSFRSKYLIAVEGLEKLTTLQTLSLTHAWAESALDLSRMINLKELQISENMNLNTLKGLDQLRNLELLRISHSAIEPEIDISNMTVLSHLSLKRMRNLKKLVGLEKTTLLTGLVLLDTEITEGIDVSNLHELESMTLHGNKQLSSVTGLSRLRSIRSLNISESPIGPDIDLSGMLRLNRIDMINNPLLTQIDGLETLDSLSIIDISGTGVHQVPVGLKGKSLEILGLCNLKLDDMPDWILDFNLDFGTSRKYISGGIKLHNTEIANMDISVFEQPRDLILKWFNDRDKVPLQEVKVVFLGDGEAGKTHTIARLLNDGNAPKPEDFDAQSTPGIVIKDKSYEIDGKPVNVHFWDFGGQEILHSMHRMFLTERTLYVVLLNARDDTQDDRARYWLHNIRSFAGNSPVLLVLNKIDQNPNANVNEPELKELYGGLRRVVNLSALEYTPEQFNAALTDALKEEIRALGTVGTLWPASWARLKTGLETMESKYITGTQYKRMCLDSGVDKNQKDLLHWFNDLGVSFCYEGNRRLEHYVILRPEWITNGIYILLFNKSDETKNGVIPKQVIYEMLDPDDENAYRRVLGGVTYDVNETEYVLEVMRKFRLSYAISDEAEFIPALCQRNSMPIATEYANDPDALEFRLTYDYLPDNVIHRLMVEMRQDLQLSDVWRTGALFRQTGTGLSAVVKSEGDVLRIFVRSDNALHRPNTYLCILKENIDRINRDMKLASPFAEVVYKTARGKELFDYEDLLNAFEEGREGYRSKKLRRNIPIQDILNQTGRGAELALEKLRDDILTACLQMQQNRSFWTANEESRIEDERNTYLRDTLINLGYIASDQHLQGLGSGSRSYGELDLDIRREPAIPWTILEALRIKDGSKTDWNRHLKKLLDNYNPSGMRHLFLLTYVDCSKDDFEEILRKFSEHIKWHDEGSYVRLENTFSHVPLPGFGDPHYLQVMRCTYDRSGAPTTVTHIFVRMGE